MIAQEVEEVFPDWVEENRRGHKTVTYRGFEALTVEALRDLRAEKDSQIAVLRKQNALQAEQIAGLKHNNIGMRKSVDQLEAQNDALQSKLDSLQQLVQQLASRDQERSK